MNHLLVKNLAIAIEALSRQSGYDMECLRLRDRINVELNEEKESKEHVKSTLMDDEISF